jgi:DNA ligase-1
VKDPTNPDNEELQYWVYDMPKVAGLENPTFIQRFEAYEDKFQKRFSQGCVEYLETLPVVRVNAMFALGESNIHSQHNWWVARGFEGIIIRNHAGLYTFGQRSHDLLKLKNFVDAEFTIIGANEDADGGVVWVCRTDRGDAFGVRPKGTLEDRQNSLASWESMVGKKLTVRYQNFSEKGVPIFPVGIGVRDYE